MPCELEARLEALEQQVSSPQTESPPPHHGARLDSAGDSFKQYLDAQKADAALSKELRAELWQAQEAERQTRDEMERRYQHMVAENMSLQEALRQPKAEAESEISHLKSEVESLQRQLASQQHSSLAGRAESEQLLSDIAAVRTGISQRDETISNLKQTLGNERESVGLFQQEVVSLKRELEQAGIQFAQNSAQDDEIQKLLTDIMHLKSAGDQREQTIASLREALDEQRRQMKSERQEEVQETRRQLFIVEGERDQLSSEIAEIRYASSQHEQAISGLKLSLEEERRLKQEEILILQREFQQQPPQTSAQDNEIRILRSDIMHLKSACDQREQTISSLRDAREEDRRQIMQLNSEISANRVQYEDDLTTLEAQLKDATQLKKRATVDLSEERMVPTRTSFSMGPTRTSLAFSPLSQGTRASLTRISLREAEDAERSSRRFSSTAEKIEVEISSGSESGDGDAKFEVDLTEDY